MMIRHAASTATLMMVLSAAAAAAPIRADTNTGNAQTIRASDGLELKLAWHAVYARSAVFDPAVAVMPLPDKPRVLDDSGVTPQSSASAQDDRVPPLVRNVRVAGAIDHAPSHAEKSGSVPEPGRWAMLLAGLLGVGAIARRRSIL